MASSATGQEQPLTVFPIADIQGDRFMLLYCFAAFHDFLVAVIFNRKSGNACNYAGFRRYENPKLGRQASNLGRKTAP